MSMAFSGVDTKVTGWESLLVVRCCFEQKEYNINPRVSKQKKKTSSGMYAMSFHGIALTSRISEIPITRVYLDLSARLEENSP